LGIYVKILVVLINWHPEDAGTVICDLP